MKPGIYSGLTHGDLPPGLSPSGAKTLLFKTPAVYKYEREHPKAPSRAMVLGTLAHSLVLEGKTGYMVCRDGRTKDGKADKDECRERGLSSVSADEAAQIEGMAKAVLEHETAANILSEGQPEQAVIWTDEQTGVTCRGFIDWLHPKAIVDLKTTDDVSPVGFGKTCANLAYDIQSWMYRDAIQQLTGEWLPFLHIAVQKTPPYLVTVQQLPPEADERGQRLTRQALDLYAQCVERDEWPGYDTDIIPTTWPHWA